MSSLEHASSSAPCTSELHTSAALLISVFGQPAHAGAEVTSYRWQLNFEEDGQARLFTQSGGNPTAATLLTWRVEADCAAALARVEQALQAGENYYEGTLHPELFIRRSR